MSWSKSVIKRSYQCNPELLRFLRSKKGWSQKRLAKESGYSERLICKAEAGLSVSSEAIEVLAKALSTEDLQLKPEDLICDPIALSKKFIEALHLLQRDLVKGIAHFTDPRGEFNFVQCAMGDYAGSYQGIAALNIAAGKFFDAQEFVAGQDFKSSYQYFGSENEVVAWGTSTIRVKETGEILNISITLRLVFEKGRLSRVEDRSEVIGENTDRDQ